MAAQFLTSHLNLKVLMFTLSEINKEDLLNIRKIYFSFWCGRFFFLVDKNKCETDRENKVAG